MRDKYRAKYHKKLKAVSAGPSKAHEQTQQQEKVSDSVILEEIDRQTREKDTVKPN